ncbi:hypothetical protein ThvES_00018040 [Thiovulum sp. ES]|nr:hypothetical protein ThvES_00018040 [Thiovulum sp. ES]
MNKPILLSAITSSLLFGTLEIERAVFSSVGGEWENEEYKMNISFGGNFIADFEDRVVENNETILVHHNLGHYSNPEDYNIEPKITIPTSFLTNEDTRKLVEFSIQDEENDVVDVAISKNPIHGIVSNTGSYFRYSPVANYYGYDYLSIKFDDDFGGIVTKDIRIFVSPVDDFPYLTPISSQTADEDSFALTVKIELSDIDSDVKEAEYFVETDNEIVEVLMSDSNLILTPLPDQFGEARIKVSAKLDRKTAIRSFLYTLNPLDDAPILEEISNQNVLEDSETLSIGIQLSDIDSNLTNAIYTVSNSNSEIANAEVIDTNLRVTPIRDMFGSAIITVSAELDGKIVETAFNYNLESVDDAPTLEKIENYSSSGESNEIPLNLADIDSDIANANFSVESSNPDIAIGQVENGTLFVSRTGSESGSTIFKVSATLDEHTVSQIFQYTVQLSEEDEKEEEEETKIGSFIDISLIDDIDLEMSSENQELNIDYSINSTYPISSIQTYSNSDGVIVSNTENEISVSVLAGFSGDSKITLIATDENGEIEQETFFVSVSVDNNLVCLHQSSNELTFETIRGGNENQNYVTSNLNLIESLGSCGLEIPVSWSSSNENIISTFGEVYIDSEKDYTIQLVATIGENRETKKSFLITVPKDEINDQVAVENNLEILTFDLIKDRNLLRKEIYNPLYLPTNGVSDVEISWISNSDEVESDGTIYPTDEDIPFSLTATLSRGEFNSTKTFSLVLKAEQITDLDIVNEDKRWLSIENILAENKNSDNVKTSLNLQDYGANGSSIEWISSDVNIISETGEVFRDANENKHIKLRAIISSGNESVEKEFLLKVLKAVEVVEDTGLEFDRVEDDSDENLTTISMFLKKESDEKIISSKVLLAQILKDVSDKIVTSDEVKITIEKNGGKASIYLKSDGTASTKFETLDSDGNSFETKIDISVEGSESEVSEDGKITAKTDKGSASISEDGKIEVISGNSKTKLNLAGGTVSINSDAIKTVFEEIVGDRILKAEVSTDNSYKSKTSFIILDLESGEKTEFDTLNENSIFEDNSTFKIDRNSNDELMIEIETEISTDLEFK